MELSIVPLLHLDLLSVFIYKPQLELEASNIPYQVQIYWDTAYAHLLIQ